MIYTSAGRSTVPTERRDAGGRLLDLPKGKVLIVDDDEETRRLLERKLAGRGCEVATAGSGEEGVAIAFRERPDLVILDVDMPGMGGIQACQEIRRSLYIPIILLSERVEESDMVLGLGVGGDYYLPKPIREAELLSHVEAALRRETAYRRRSQQSDLLHIRDLTLDLAEHELRRNGKPIPVTFTEFKLIEVLAQNAGRILTRDQLLDCVWDTRAEGVYSRTVDVHVARIRRKIGDDPHNQRYIITVPGIGYKMVRA